MWKPVDLNVQVSEYYCPGFCSIAKRWIHPRYTTVDHTVFCSRLPNICGRHSITAHPRVASRLHFRRSVSRASRSYFAV